MTTRKEIAKMAAKVAAFAAYKSVMSAPINKTAQVNSRTGARRVIVESPGVEEIAKVAAKSAYNGVLKAAQVMDLVDPQMANVQGLALRFGPRNLALRLSGQDVAVSQADVNQFLAAVSGSYGEDFKNQVAKMVASVAPYQPAVAPPVEDQSEWKDVSEINPGAAKTPQQQRREYKEFLRQQRQRRRQQR